MARVNFVKLAAGTEPQVMGYSRTGGMTDPSTGKQYKGRVRIMSQRKPDGTLRMWQEPARPQAAP